jgi:transposase
LQATIILRADDLHHDHPQPLSISETENVLFKLIQPHADRVQDREKRRRKKLKKNELEKENKLIKAEKIQQLVRENYRDPIIAKELRCSVSLVREVRIKYERDEEWSVAGKRGRPAKLKGDHIQYVANLMGSESAYLLTLDSIRKRLLSAFPDELKSLSLHSIYDLLKRLGYSYRRSSSHKYLVNSDMTIRKRYDYVVQIIPYLQSGFMDVYIDECSFNLSSRKLYGWSKKNIDFKLNTSKV